MRFNTPPRQPEIEDDEGGELILIDNDLPPPDDDEDESEDDGLDIDDEMDYINRTYSDPITDDSIITFKEHTAPVFSCDLHPSKDWAVSGGEDDKAFVWNTETTESIYEVEGHKDTVIETHFSHDGSYLATADMAGEVQVFKITDKFKKVWEYSMGDMSWLRWHRAANVLLAGSENGEIYVWRIPSDDCKILPGNGHKCEAGELTPDGKKIYAGYSNGAIKLWDIKTSTVKMEVNEQHPMVHIEAVSSVSCDKEAPLYMSGGQDGKIIFCTNNGPVGSVEARGPVECVSFSPSNELKMAASGTLHGQIAVWDFSKYSMRVECEHPEIDDGVTKLKWISDSTFLVATIQGYIYGYDARTGLRKFKLSGHKADVYDFCYDSQKNILLSVSEDLTAKIFRLPPLGD